MKPATRGPGQRVPRPRSRRGSLGQGEKTRHTPSGGEDADTALSTRVWRFSSPAKMAGAVRSRWSAAKRLAELGTGGLHIGGGTEPRSEFLVHEPTRERRQYPQVLV